MKIVRRMRKMAVVVTAALLVAMLWSAQALAGQVALTLVRTAGPTNVADAAGLWQHEGGIIQKPAGVAVGQYAIHRRVTNGGTNAQNTAMTTVTLFFTLPASVPPQNVTLEGAWSFSTGRFSGSVSAASNRFNWVQGADAFLLATQTVGTSTLTITWTGSSQLTLP